MSGKRHLFPNDFKACDNCRGRGTVSCSSCGGKGDRETRRYGSSGYAETARDSCSLCLGTGARRCNYCGGTGDQRIYGAASSAGEDGEGTFDDAAGESEMAWDSAPQNYGALFAAKLQEAEAQRQQIVAWIWQADAFSTEYKMNFANWLGGLPLDHPEASPLLNEVARQLHQPGLATQAGTLGYMLGALAGSCGLLEMYKMMIE